jgi:uncharacterized protein
MRMRATTLVIAALVCAQACSPAKPPTPVPTEATPTPIDATAVVPTPAPKATDAVARLLASVAGDATPSGSELDVMWRSVINETRVEGASPYVSPSRLVPYAGGDVPKSACSAGIAARFWRNNAYYCAVDGSILYDAGWVRDFASRAGPYAPVAIIAHEWGHHIQAMLRISGLSIQTELQADCFAGLYLANTEQVLPGITGPADDLTATLKTFFAIGNSRYQASAWFQAGEHGSPQQRIRAFGTGYAASFKTPDQPPPLGRGIAVCYGYKDFAPADFGEVGPFRILNLPGRSEAMVDGWYVVEPEDRLGFPTSAVALRWLRGQSAQEIVAKVGAAIPGLKTYPPSIDLAGQVSPGTGFANYFEQRSPTLPAGVRSGMLGLVQPKAADGGLMILVYRPTPMLSEPLDDQERRELSEQISLLYEVITRLCGPDDSAVVGNTSLKVTCLPDQ